MMCECELKSEQSRILCLLNQFNKLMRKRGKQPLDIDSIVKETTSLKTLNLLHITETSITLQLAESQIFYTFIEEYVKTHPNFLFTGPDLGDLKLKTTFFRST